MFNWQCATMQYICEVTDKIRCSGMLVFLNNFSLWHLIPRTEKKKNGFYWHYKIYRKLVKYSKWRPPLAKIFQQWCTSGQRPSYNIDFTEMKAATVGEFVIGLLNIKTLIFRIAIKIYFTVDFDRVWDSLHCFKSSLESKYD